MNDSLYSALAFAPPIRSTSEIPSRYLVAIAKLHSVVGQRTWYVVECSPTNHSDYMLFCYYVAPGEPEEWRYVALSDLRHECSILGIRHDPLWHPTAMGYIFDGDIH